MTQETVHRRLGRNLAFLGSAELLTRGLTFLVTLIAARVLGPAEYGQVALTQLVVFFLAAVGDAGLTTWTQRQIVLRPHDLSRLIIETLVAQLAIALSLGGMLAAVFAVLPLAGGTDRLVLLALPFAITEGLSIVYALQALERMRPVAGVRIVTQVVTVITALTGLALHNIEAVVCSFWVGQLVGDVLAYLALRAHLEWVRPRAKSILLAIRSGAPILATRALYQYAFTIGGFLLALLASKEVVGFYNAAIRPLALAPLILIVVMNAVFPELVRRGASDAEQLGAFTARIVAFTLRGSLFVAVLLCVEARPVIRLLYGQRYERSIELMRIAAFLFPVFCLSLLLLQAFLAVGRSTALVVACGCGAVFATASVPVLYRTTGVTGVTVSTVTTGLIMSVGLVLMSRVPAPSQLMSIVVIESSSAAILLGGALVVGDLVPGPNAVVLGVAAVLGAALMEVLRGFPTRHDLSRSVRQGRHRKMADATGRPRS